MKACAPNAATGAPALRVAVSTRALFDLEAEHALFEIEGVGAYVERQRGLEGAPLAKGPGFEAIDRLLRLNRPGRPRLVDVVLLSRNAPDVSLRTFAAISAHGLDIANGSFTNGGPIGPLLQAWRIDLLLSNEAADVEAALAVGVAAARFSSRGRHPEVPPSSGLRIAFDGDGVLFGYESNAIFESEGLAAFLRHETSHALQPMERGPFGQVLSRLAALQVGGADIRIALVTARSAPAHARAIHTLRSWGAKVDEAHFVGDADKHPILAAFGADLFFDDSKLHVDAARDHVASAHVPRVQRN